METTVYQNEKGYITYEADYGFNVWTVDATGKKKHRTDFDAEFLMEKENFILVAGGYLFQIGAGPNDYDFQAIAQAKQACLDAIALPVNYEEEVYALNLGETTPEGSAIIRHAYISSSRDGRPNLRFDYHDNDVLDALQISTEGKARNLDKDAIVMALISCGYEPAGTAKRYEDA